jgi:hypothetical protein
MSYLPCSWTENENYELYRLTPEIALERLFFAERSFFANVDTDCYTACSHQCQVGQKHSARLDDP